MRGGPGANFSGEFDNPNIEAIVAAEPDLILFVAVAGDDFYTPIMDKLRQTGIPVFAAFNGYLSVDEFYRLMNDAGTAVRREDKARQILADFEARLAEVKSRIQASGEVESAAFLRVWPWDGTTANTLMPLLDALEVPGDRADAAAFSIEVSPENLSQFNQDVLFVGDGQDQAKTKAALEANPLWAQLPAVAAGRVVWVSDLTWGSGYSMPAVDSMLTDIERAYLG